MAEVSLLHFDGSNGSTTIVDQHSRVWTANGTAALSTSTPNIGTARGNCGDTGSDYFQTTVGLTDFTFGTGDFFIQLKIFARTTAGPYSIFFEWNTTGSQYALQAYSSGADLRIDSLFGDAGASVTWIDGNLHELAIGRLSGNWAIWADGTIIASGASSANFPAPSRVILGAASDGNGRPIAVDEFRVFKGECPALSNYTPSTSPYPDPGGDVTVALTGVEGTGSVGDAADSLTVGLSGNSATASVGDVVDSLTVGLTGIAGTGAVGTVVQSRAVALTNVVATGSVGTVTQSLAVDLSGVGAPGDVGQVAVEGNADVTIALSGVEATSAPGDLAASVDLSLVGNAGTASVGDAVASLSSALSGVAAAEGTGTLAADVVFGLSGVAGSGSVGTIAPSLALALAGQQADAAVGDVAIAGAGPGAALSGVQGTASTGAVGMSVTISLAGVAGSGFAGYVGLSDGPAVLGSLIGRTRHAFGIRSSVQTSTRRNEQSSKR